MSGRQVEPLFQVAVVSHDSVPFGFAYDLANLMSYTVATFPGIPVGLQSATQTYLDAGRQELLELLVREGSTHILWLDADMRFPPDTFERLLAHDLPVVGINYAQRGLPSDFVAIKRVGYGESAERLVTDEHSTGLEEVEAIGFGALMMRAEVFSNLPPLSEGAWFDTHWLPEYGQWEGEDVRFCRHLREQGYSIYVDHDLSKECRHIGSFEYRLEYAQMSRDSEEGLIEVVGR